MAREAAPFSALPEIYDAVMRDVEYEDWCGFALGQLEDLGWLDTSDPARLRVLDLACGTGNSTRPLAEMGFQVEGADASEAMLEVARRKLPQVRFSRAEFTRLDLASRFHLVLCVFDSLNNLTSEDELLAAFRAVGRHLEPGGCLAFDANTPSGVADLWDGGVFEGEVKVDGGSIHYRWSHHYDAATGLGQVTAYWSGRQGEVVERHTERGYDAGTLSRLLLEAGFSEAEAREYPDGNEPDDDAPRIWMLARTRHR
ncbi:MAG TPA: methyltransferase domain-containing protein [Deinococcales bacterium]|nr:methyltransferase domain-containing protein [Deinococcales bacterium]